jgi:hypothetical protein
MTAMSNYFENTLVNHVFRGTSFSAPSNLYVALFTSSASLAELETGTLTNEVSGNAYNRVTIACSTGNWDATSGTDGTTKNTNAIIFPTATPSGWGTIQYAAVMDTATPGTGNILIYGELGAPKTINVSDTFAFNAGDFTVVFA